jgi:hypothetical protein
VGSHGNDINNAAFYAPGNHQFDRRLHQKKGARVLTAMMASNNSGEVSRMVPRSDMPAQFTSPCSVPNADSAAPTTFAGFRRTDIRLDEYHFTSAMAKGFCLFTSGFHVTSANNDASCPTLYQQTGNRCAESGFRR